MTFHDLIFPPATFWECVGGGSVACRLRGADSATGERAVGGDLDLFVVASPVSGSIGLSSGHPEGLPSCEAGFALPAYEHDVLKCLYFFQRA